MKAPPAKSVDPSFNKICTVELTPPVSKEVTLFVAVVVSNAAIRLRVAPPLLTVVKVPPA